MVVLIAATIIPVYNKTDSASATAGTPTASTLTFTSTNPVASVSLAMGSPTGTFATSSSSEKAAFSISTNNYTGYTLTMTSTGASTALTDDNSHNISTISSSTTEAIFSSSDAAGQALNNRWGYIPSYYNSAANITTYYPAPTSVNAATLRTTSSANSSNGVDNADDYTIGLGFRADYNSPSGTYANDTFILEFVANTIAYTITYDKNTTDTVTNMPANQSGDASTTSITLSSAIPTRNKYFFMGWCHGTVTTANNYDTCDGTIYNPDGDGTNLDFGIDQTNANNTTLYAMWDRTYTLTFKTATNATSVVFNGETYTNNQTKTIRASQLTNPYHIYGNYASRYAFSSWAITAGTLGNSNYQNTTYTVTDDATITLTGRQVTTVMQNLAFSSCTTTATPVYDNRDNSVYWIQKLADGNCWMLDNMTLDLTNSTTINAITTSNTDVDAPSLVSLKSGNRTNGNQYATAGFAVWNSSNPSNYQNVAKANSESKATILAPENASPYTNSIAGAYGIGQGKIGMYYNYCAASAGNYCYDQNFGSGNSTSSICPRGWRMPTGKAGSGEYSTLCAAIKGSSCVTTREDYETMDANNPNSFQHQLSTPLSGIYYDGSPMIQGSRGLFWTSTLFNVGDMYAPDVHSDSIYPQYANNRNLGYTLRCINPSYYTITFKTNNATGIVFNGVTYTDGQTVRIPKSEAATNKYHIYGTYGTRYAFSSWSTTVGTFDNQSYQNTAFTVTGDTTITLTGQYVNTAMQNLSISNCSTTAMPVYDNRDSSVYWVQKLADGNCWMLDNLALDLTSSSIVNSLSTSNTNLDSTSLAKFKDGSGNTSDRYPTAAYANWGSSPSYSQPLTNMDSKNITLRPSTATSYTGSIAGAHGQGQGKVGGYYNYCAASVGYYCFGNGNSEGSPSGNNDYDVCPAGWRMPAGGASGEYNALYTSASINSDATTYRNVFSATFSGDIASSSVQNRGSFGYFWSSTMLYYYSMYSLTVSSSGVSPTAMHSRNYGSTIRCINPSYYTITFKTNNATGIVFNGVTYTDGQTLKIPKDEAAVNKYHIYGTYGTRYAFSSWSTTAGTFENQNYQNTAFTVTGDTTITLTGQYVATAMQNLSASDCTTTARPVYDNRDSSIYWIQRLPDNNCWMLDNLALNLTSSSIVNKLSTANTNLDSTSLTYFKNGGGTSSDRYPITAYGTFGSTNSYSQPLTNVSSRSITLRPSTATNYTGSFAGAYGLGQGKIGAYYNYCAASVGYYCYGNGTSAGTSSGNNAYDVCPAGWRMPTGNTSGEYNTLYTNASINSDATTYRNTLSTPLSGNFYSGSAISRGSGGYFWSSTRNNNNSMYDLGVASLNINRTDYSNRYGGYSVRCVLGS